VQEPEPMIKRFRVCLALAHWILSGWRGWLGVDPGALGETWIMEL